MKRKLWTALMSLVVMFSVNPSAAKAASPSSCLDATACNNLLDCPAACTLCDHNGSEMGGI
jgi:hypothetical protein